MSYYNIEGRLSVELFFGGDSFPFGPVRVLNYIHVSNTNRLILPYISLSVTDNDQWLRSNQKLVDGVQITVKVLTGENNSKFEASFRASFFKEDFQGGIRAYIIEGYLDFPRYLIGTSAKAVRGSSSSVLSQIAQACGLTFEGIGTNDSQVWYGSNRPFHEWAVDVARHGFTTESGCLSMMVALDGCLKYVDISAMGEPVATLGILETSTPGVIPVVGFEPMSTSGASNVLTGYSYSTVEQALSGADIYTVHDNVRADLNEGNSAAVNPSVRASIGSGAIVHSSPSSDNVHPKYIRALHQNSRVSNLFSVQLAVTLPHVTAIRCLDTVTVSASVLMDQDNPSMSVSDLAGLYRVLGKVIYITQGTVYEKLTLGRRTQVASMTPATTPSSTVGGLTAAAPPLSKKVAPSQKSSLTIPSFNVGMLTAAISSIGTAMSASLSGVASRASSVLNSVSSMMTSHPEWDITVQKTLTLNDIASAEATGLAAIAAYKAANSGSPPPTYATDLTNLATTAKNNITAVIASHQPALTLAASKSSAISSNLSTTTSAVSASSTSALSSPPVSVFQSLASFSSSGAVHDASVAQSGSVNASSASAVSTSASAVASATTLSSTLSSDAADYASVIDARRALAFSNIDAAAVP